MRKISTFARLFIAFCLIANSFPVQAQNHQTEESRQVFDGGQRSGTANTVRLTPRNYLRPDSADRSSNASILAPIGLGIAGAAGLRALARSGRSRAAGRLAPLALGLGAAAAVVGATGCGPGEPEPGCDGEVDIRNETRLETFAVYVDGDFAGYIEPGRTQGFLILSGNRHIAVYESYSGDLLYGINITLLCGDLVAWSVTDPYESELNVNNETGGYVSVSVDGDYYDSVGPGYWALPVREGDRLLRLSDYEDGELFYNSVDSFESGFAYEYTVYDPICGELDVYNGTGEDVSVVMDGYSFGYQPWGDIWGYSMNDDYHLVQAIGRYSGYVYFDQTDYYGCGTYYLDLY
ncbi:MAG: hypothetical protein HYT79_09370 [Elusimicrobia bacterium]|nr:hypothetical protein [Elusimicrobiota bacterium]